MLLTPTQFAEIVGLSRQRIHQLIKKDRIRPRPIRVAYSYVMSDKSKIIRVKGGRPRKSLTRVK